MLERAVAEAPADTRLAEMSGPLAAGGRAPRSHAAEPQRAVHRLLRRAGGSGGRGSGAGVARSRLLADWRSAVDLSQPADFGGAVHRRTVPRHHAVAARGRRAPTTARIRVPMRGALDNPKELDRVLAHEFVHALVSTLAPRNVPTWLNEGLATALEADSLDWARDRVAHASAPVSLNALRSSFGRLTGAQAQVAYATSALAVVAAARRGGRVCHGQPASRSRRRRRLRRGVPASHAAAVRRVSGPARTTDLSAVDLHVPVNRRRSSPLRADRRTCSCASLSRLVDLSGRRRSDPPRNLATELVARAAGRHRHRRRPRRASPAAGAARHRLGRRARAAQPRRVLPHARRARHRLLPPHHGRSGRHREDQRARTGCRSFRSAPAPRSKATSTPFAAASPSICGR